MLDIAEFSESLASTDSSLWIQSHDWVIPTVQSLHILALAVIFSASVLLNLRMAGAIGREEPLAANARRFLPWIWWALPVQLVTGAVMIMGEPARELLNSLFWYKMLVLVLVIVIMLAVQRLLHDAPFRELPLGRRAIVRALALVSLGAWAVIVICGRWIAYT